MSSQPGLAEEEKEAILVLGDALTWLHRLCSTQILFSTPKIT